MATGEDDSDFEDAAVGSSDSDDDFESASKKQKKTASLANAKANKSTAESAKPKPQASKPATFNSAASSTPPASASAACSAPVASVSAASSAPTPSASATSNAPAAPPVTPATRPPSAAPGASSSSAKANVLVAAIPSGADAVLDYVRQHNAPLNAQMVADKFRGSLSKGQAEKHLLALAENGSIVFKENGKSKIFYASQEGLSAPSAAEAQQLNVQIGEAQLARAQLADELNSVRAAISACRKPKKTLQDWKAEEATIRGELSKLKAEVETALQATSAAPISESQAKKISDEYTKLLKEYKRRRRICLELLDNLSEGMQMSRKKLMADWELEADEDYDVDPKQFPALPVPRSGAKQFSSKR